MGNKIRLHKRRRPKGSWPITFFCIKFPDEAVDLLDKEVSDFALKRYPVMSYVRVVQDHNI